MQVTDLVGSREHEAETIVAVLMELCRVDCLGTWNLESIDYYM